MNFIKGNIVAAAWAIALLAPPNLGFGQQNQDDVTAQITLASGKFAKAFNAADAAGIAQLFTEKGEFVSVQNLVYSGREAIKSEFAAVFEALPNSAINIQIDSIREISNDLAIEDGQATVATSDGTTSLSRYSLVYQKTNGEWKIASLRDHSSEAMTPGDNLVSLQWLIGSWVSESRESVVEYQFYWSEDGNYILNNFNVTVDGIKTLTGTQRLGWDPQKKQIRAWTFDSKGGFVSAEWSNLADRWVVKTSGVNADGSSATSTNFYRMQDNGQLLWLSTDRVVAGVEQDDVQLKLVRRPPVPAKDE